MANAIGLGQDRYLAPGTKVRYQAYVNGEDHLTSEFGVVVHCWFDDELGLFDCYVAFFGEAFPSVKPEETPYVLRYAAVGLAEIVD